MTKQCAFINANGDSCGGYAVNDDIYCFSHSPKYKNEKLEASRKGGSTSKRNDVKLNPVMIKTSQDIMDLLTDTINLIRTSTISTAVANSVGYLANGLFKGLELVNFEKRLSELELKDKNYTDGLTINLNEGEEDEDERKTPQSIV